MVIEKNKLIIIYMYIYSNNLIYNFEKKYLYFNLYKYIMFVWINF